VTKAKNAVEIPVEKIDRDPAQPREEFDLEALGRLAESLRTRGQLQPIRVHWDEGREIYKILVGERRWRAARMAGISTLSAVVVDGPLDPAELLAIQLVENCLREDLRPIEQARAYRTLMERNGWSARQVARELAIDHTGVARALALLSLPESVQEAVEAGQIAPRTGYELTKVSDPEEARELAEEVRANKLSRDAIAQRVRQKEKGRGVTRTKGKGKTRLPAEIRHRCQNGVRVTVQTASRHGLEDAIAGLEEFVAELRERIDRESRDAA
jgi:ParB family chromosome partitioning protein